MSALATDTGPHAGTGGGIALFDYEIRRDKRVVARIRAYPSGSGITVESQVFPLTQPPDGGGVTRPFSFQTLEQAHRFADEALLAFEYLNCTIA